MATILLSWEMGFGLGHITNVGPIGKELVRRGHRVVAALRDITHAPAVLADSGISFLLAPVAKYQPKARTNHVGLAQVLRDVGLGNVAVMGPSFAAWNTILELVKPDLVVADHSPFAFLASRGLPIRRVNVGMGFFCPPDQSQLPAWVSPERTDLLQQLAKDECELTDSVNRFLRAHGRPELPCLSKLFNDIDLVILATYRELDHFGARCNMRYWGHWPFGATHRPHWPSGEGPKIYAYLKPFPGLELLLQLLQQSGSPTLVFSGGIEPDIQKRYSCSTMRFETQPIDLQRAATECELSITHAGHGTLAAFLLAGKPCVMIPPFVEQLLLSKRVEQMGAGRMAVPNQPQAVVEATRDVISNLKYKRGAQAFASRYTGFVAGEQIPSLVDRLESLLQREPAVPKAN